MMFGNHGRPTQNSWESLVPDGLGFNESLQLIKSLIKGRKVLGFDVVEFSPIKNFFAYDFTVASLVYRIMELIDLND